MSKWLKPFLFGIWGLLLIPLITPILGKWLEENVFSDPNAMATTVFDNLLALGQQLPKQGKFRRALAAVGAWLQALDYTGFDYTLDRTERLEQELAQLKEELRQSREASSGDAHPGGAVSRKASSERMTPNKCG